MKVISSITTSVDGYITGPNDGPGRGLGDGGERLHYWVFGGPWSYDTHPLGKPNGTDAEFFDRMVSNLGAVVGGRGTFYAADGWGGHNPFGVPFFIVTHRPEEEPAGGAFDFVDGLEDAVARAKEAAGTADVSVMGGADIIRQALAAGMVDELSISTAPCVLGAGKSLFEGFNRSVELEPMAVLQSQYATHVTYKVHRS